MPLTYTHPYPDHHKEGYNKKSVLMGGEGRVLRVTPPLTPLTPLTYVK